MRPAIRLCRHLHDIDITASTEYHMHESLGQTLLDDSQAPHVHRRWGMGVFNRGLEREGACRRR